MEVKFYGVRGSTPCSCPQTAGVGGNTSCVLIQAAGAAPILLDLGTGLRYFGHDWKEAHPGEAFSGLALVSHLHWDHVQGIPFFPPVRDSDSVLHVIAPPQPGATKLSDVFDAFLQPPMFPVRLADFAGAVTFESRAGGTIDHGPLRVTIRAVQHNGATNGYRIDDPRSGHSVAYISDHQQPTLDSTHIDNAALELCDGVDVLIHDAQYDNAEFAVRQSWGHSTIEYAVEVAARSGAKHLCLFHHDPSHNDEWIANAVAEATGIAAGRFTVSAAIEGESINL